jgi:hypothetical protein
MKSRVAIFIAATAILPIAATAGPSEDLVAGMAKCAAVADNTVRLACYDALAPQLKAAQTPVAPPAAEAAENRPWYDPGRIFGTSPSQQTKPEQFGAENLAPPPPPPPKPGEAPPPPEPEALDSITAKVTDYALNPYGRFVVFLDNGQVWRQLEGDTDRAHFRKNGGETVVISRGMLGSYNLVVNDAGPAFKVHRVK